MASFCRAVSRDGEEGAAVIMERYFFPTSTSTSSAHQRRFCMYSMLPDFC
ncbi:MAG TPA: hypothetical protein DEB17_04865 [Chlorobaculum sp.]|uniref:Uncharacterized protein n=1 Tax=Chlorobaculum tepidum (strain ATCC 49652 / DSM 12025 / NBRC 103806 / TLS) TaxID=194439 RepID=Q8KB14_CHLTE|nr:hypothetical protein CT1984 [Chlorobaculum tepidum TLS]HBU23316.1 hypothetical protein [Chlorobaculum sp.]